MTYNPHIVEDLTRLRDEIAERAFVGDRVADGTAAMMVWKINSCLYRGYPRRNDTPPDGHINKGNEMTDYQADIQSQIVKTRAELKRVKDFVNTNGYDCTSALFFIVQRYRLELKQHLNNLMDNLGDIPKAENHIERRPIGACMSTKELRDALDIADDPTPDYTGYIFPHEGYWKITGPKVMMPEYSNYYMYPVIKCTREGKELAASTYVAEATIDRFMRDGTVWRAPEACIGDAAGRTQ